MTSKAEYTEQWQKFSPEERRVGLDHLGSKEDKTDDEQREHDALATMVAEDEQNAQAEITKPKDEDA